MRGVSENIKSKTPLILQLINLCFFLEVRSGITELFFFRNNSSFIQGVEKRVGAQKNS